MTGAELKKCFDQLFPHGFAGADVVREIAPEQWENSPLLACFHPGPQQVLKERVLMHESMQELPDTRQKPDATETGLPPQPTPTIEEVLTEWKEQPINVTEEVTQLVGLCLGDVFSHNHKVIAAGSRMVDIGSFRYASAFLDEYITGPRGKWDCGDEYRFYMGSRWISRRADLKPVYKMIFRRLKSVAADWSYQFPQVYLVDLSPLREAMEKKPETYSPSEAFAKEQEERELQAELRRTKEELEELQNQNRREAMDRPPPRIVQAYQEVYGRDPKGWPPMQSGSTERD